MVQDSHNTRVPSGETPSVGALLAKVTENISALVRDEIELVQTQLTEKGKAMGLGIGLFVGAGVFGLFMLGWLLTAGMFGLATVMPYWAASLIVAGVLLVVVVILALLGKSALSKAPSPHTGENIKKDVEAVKQGVKS
ncbi:phage holin family protein [Pseudactinotalea sp. Z1748]|uniref:phage holin family protein n=1 Tax=Pseudactinotalea sp. Z1748 TaxID=3413027 RepID=UPI003C7EC9F3